MPRALVLFALVLAVGCGPRPVALATYRQPAEEFTVAYPAGWTVDDRDPQRVRIAPSPEGPDFILVVTAPLASPPSDDEVRRDTLIRIGAFGVSKFQRDPRSTPEITWHRFEVTGTTEGEEWASIGAVAVGARKSRTVVCAGGFSTWRAQQKVCDRIVAAFDPGRLE